LGLPSPHDAPSPIFSGEENEFAQPILVLPTGPALYNANVWLSGEMRQIRLRYTQFVLKTFDRALDAYYEKDWVNAKEAFEAVNEKFEDGPSQYFLKEMEKHGGKPPRDFQGYGRA
jgi:hypothetical protein